jgi:hypothetical protein
VPISSAPRLTLLVVRVIDTGVIGKRLERAAAKALRRRSLSKPSHLHATSPRHTRRIPSRSIHEATKMRRFDTLRRLILSALALLAVRAAADSDCNPPVGRPDGDLDCVDDVFD